MIKEKLYEMSTRQMLFLFQGVSYYYFIKNSNPKDDVITPM